MLFRSEDPWFQDFGSEVRLAQVRALVINQPVWIRLRAPKSPAGIDVKLNAPAISAGRRRHYKIGLGDLVAEEKPHYDEPPGIGYVPQCHFQRCHLEDEYQLFKI